MADVAAVLLLCSSVWASPRTLHHLHRVQNMLQQAEAPIQRGAPPTPFDRMGDARQDSSALPAEVVVTPRPEDYLADGVLPLEWDWRDVASGDATRSIDRSISRSISLCLGTVVCAARAFDH